MHPDGAVWYLSPLAGAAPTVQLWWFQEAQVIPTPSEFAILNPVQADLGCHDPRQLSGCINPRLQQEITRAVPSILENH